MKLVNKITIVGLGAGDLNQLPLGVYRLLKGERDVFLRTKEHPVVSQLEKEGFSYRSFDDLYERYDSFIEVYEHICKELLQEAKRNSVIYAVPGHPLVAEKTAQLLLARGEAEGVEIQIYGGQSFIDYLLQAVKIDPIEGFQLLDGTNLKREEIQIRNHLFIAQVYDTFIASEVKLTLMEWLPDDYEVYIITGAGTQMEQVKKVPLYELDRSVEVNNLTSIYVPKVTDERILYKDFGKLREIIAELRGPDGCPWDKKQTHESLKKYVIEEAYELVEAINEGDIDHIIEELGDVLLQVMLHSQIGEDDGYFSIDDVIDCLSDKMIRRHPHVFGTEKVDNAEQVIQNWQEIKNQEKGEDKEGSLLDSINKALPAILEAYEIQKMAAKVGFDWEKVEDAWLKVKEEVQEFEVEMEKRDHDKLEDEWGDMVFALINVARFYHIHPEEALIKTNQKFKKRFSYVEERVKKRGIPFLEHSLDELDRYWNEAKK